MFVKEKVSGNNGARVVKIDEGSAGHVYDNVWSLPSVICHFIVFSNSGAPLEDYFRYVPLYIPLLLILLGH
jgi:hypothetical protein